MARNYYVGDRGLLVRENLGMKTFVATVLITAKSKEQAIRVLETENRLLGLNVTGIKEVKR